MPFIPDDERIIIFDLPTAAGPFMRIDELKRLKDMGVGTLLLTSMDWNKFEPKLGQYSYRYLDEALKRLELSGMRGLMPIWEKCNVSFPRDWYSQTAQGSIPLDHSKPEYILSPWSEPGQAHALEVMRLVKDHCQSDTCQVISSICRFGESLMPYGPRFYDPSALRSWTATANSKHIKPVAVLPECAEWMRVAYRNLIKGHQAILTDSPWREAWFMLHIPKQGRPVNGVDWIEDYFNDLPENVTINHITFTYFARIPPRVEPWHAKIEHYKQAYNYKAWIGAEFCNGLREGTAIRARELGMRGLILGPCHPFTGKNSIEPWMYKEIEKAARWPI